MTTKLQINVGTIGHVDHGKTTTTAALATFFSPDGKKYGIKEIDNCKEEKERGITINSRSVQYETEKKLVNHTDCPGHADFIKNMITGAAQLNCALLVVSAYDGPQAQTREHIKVASATKISHIIVLLNKIDMVSEPELVEMVKEEIGELLAANGYKKEQIQFVELSAKVALDEVEKSLPETQYGIGALKRIAEAIDAVNQDDRSMQNALPFCLTIEDTYSIPGRGTVLAGKVAAGILTRRDMAKLEIIPKKTGKRYTVDVADMQIFHRPVDEISTGSNGALLIKGGVERSDLSRGDIVVAPGSYPSFRFALVQLHLFSPSEGGRKTAICVKYSPHVFCGARDTPAEIIKIEGDQETIEPGTTANCWLAFGASLILEPDGKSLILRESNSTIGYATFVETGNVPPVQITEAVIKSSQLMEKIAKDLKISPPKTSASGSSPAAGAGGKKKPGA